MFSYMSSLLHSWNNPFINSSMFPSCSTKGIDPSRQILLRLVKEILVKFTLGMLVIVWHTIIKED